MVLDLAGCCGRSRTPAASTRSSRRVLGAVFLGEAHLLWQRAPAQRRARAVRPMRLFHWSNMYLALLFVAVALDPLLTR